MSGQRPAARPGSGCPLRRAAGTRRPTRLAAVHDRRPVIESVEQSGTPRGGGSPSPSAGGGAAAAALDWVAAWQAEDAPLLAARQRAREVGVRAVDEASAAALRVLAAAVGAGHAVEIGTGTGVATLSLLRGMRSDGVLTSIDSEPEHQRLARLSLSEAGTPSGRVRLIAGRALAVLPRLSDGAYDLVLCDASAAEAVDYLTAALRLLRPGGVLVVVGALAGGRVADPSAREPEVLAARELLRAVRDEERLTPALLPVGTGLLVAVVDAPGG